MHREEQAEYSNDEYCCTYSSPAPHLLVFICDNKTVVISFQIMTFKCINFTFMMSSKSHNLRGSKTKFFPKSPVIMLMLSFIHHFTCGLIFHSDLMECTVCL